MHRDDDMRFPWEPGGKGGKQGKPGGEEADQGRKEEFAAQLTDEYRLRAGFEEGVSARAEVSVGSPDAEEVTQDAYLHPRPAVQREPNDGADWLKAREASLRPVGRLRRWLYDDPLYRRYLALPLPRRRALGALVWASVAALLTVCIFGLSNSILYPRVEHSIRPAVAPRPAEPERLYPRPGKAVDLVEEREYSAADFKMGLDCIWLAVDPRLPFELDSRDFRLTRDGMIIATLDVRVNWDGLLRVYFGMGMLPTDEPLYLRIGVKDGGMWTLSETASARLLSPGGARPAAFTVGPVVFSAGE